MIRTIGLCAVLLLVSACSSQPPKPHDANDEKVLAAALSQVGLREGELRDIGPVAPLDNPRNRLSAAWEDGRLTVLSLQDEDLEALPDLSKANALRVLDLSGNRIAALEAARLPPSLEVLDISGNQLADLTPLAKLGGLRSLSARDTGVTDVTPLLALPLEQADLRNCRVRELPQELPKHRGFRIDLAGCPVAQPPGLLE